MDGVAKNYNQKAEAYWQLKVYRELWLVRASHFIRLHLIACILSPCSGVQRTAGSDTYRNQVAIVVQKPARNGRPSTIGMYEVGDAYHRH
eukprot:scaffold464684_cov19-Prasinocladus_malaysianus.AAC.1